MPFTPHIAIARKSYLEHYLEICSDVVKYPEDESIIYIWNLEKQDYFTISGIDIIMCQPQLTKFNQRVREMLFEYGIEYTEIVDLIMD